MGYWVKFFKDGTQECGTDEAVSQKKASWRMGRLSGIEAVSLGEAGKAEVTLTSPEGTDVEWYQFDRYEVVVSNGRQEASRMFRVIQAKITEDLVGKVFKTKRKPPERYPIYTMGSPSTGGSLYQENDWIIESSHVGKWITVTISKSKNAPRLCYTEKGNTKAESN